MQLLKFPIICLIAVLLPVMALGETVTGCRIGNDNFLYTGYQGVQPYPVSQWYIPTFATYSNPKKDFLQEWYNDYASCPKFVGNPVYGAQCAVEGITHVANNWVQNLGNTITYTITYDCPIDDQVIILLIAIGIFATYFIKREYLNII